MLGEHPLPIANCLFTEGNGPVALGNRFVTRLQLIEKRRCQCLQGIPFAR